MKKFLKIILKIKKNKIIGLQEVKVQENQQFQIFLKIILKEGYNLNTVIFSIDDFYKTLKREKKCH